VKTRSAAACWLFFVIAGGVFAQSTPRIEFSPPAWKYGMIEQGDIAKTKVVAVNRGADAVDLTFVPTCTCLTVSPATARLEPGGSVSFALSFDSKDDSGITERGYIVRTNVTGERALYYLLSGVVRVERPDAATPAWPGGPGGPSDFALAASSAIEMQYYYTPGCRSCEEFLGTEIPRLESRYGVRIAIDRRDLLDGSVYEELSAFAASIGASVNEIPALRMEGLLLQGDAEIRARLPGLLVTRSAGGSLAFALPRAPGPKGSDGTARQETNAIVPSAASAVRLAILPVMAAGLIDGINPCAFTTLIFLLASLALAGRGRREVLVIGALFTLSVFLTYLGVGLGLFAAIRAASAVSLISALLRWIIFALLIVFAALSVYDYTRIRAGRPSDMLLQLPDSLRLKIHASIRTRAKTLALAGSSLAMGFLVSIFEFACTAQVYLPTLAYLARALKRADALGLLLAYNLCFIAPLLVVFAASYLGVSSRRITVLFRSHMGKVKLALAIAFLALAALTVLT
jgi:cytochrome c biogenesis protein CcdA